MIVDNVADGRPEAVELRNTPFFPQDKYQCGPAALATILAASGANVTADELTPQVYIPARKGSLQPELIGTARRYHRVPVVIGPSLSALLTEISAGHPVLVLQNLGIRALPVWHYAVVVGYNATTDTITLRSGTDRRKVISAQQFLRSWERAGSWGIIALSPGEVPGNDDPEAYLRAVAALESIQLLQPARLAYSAGLRHWPKNAMFHLGLGNVAYRLGEFDQAEAAYRSALVIAPGNVAARNNLAQVLLDRKCLAAALATIDAALLLPAVSPVLRDALTETRRSILAHRPEDVRADPNSCPPAFR